MAALCVVLVTDQFNIGQQFWPGSDILNIITKTRKTGKDNIKVKKTKSTQSVLHVFNVIFTLFAGSKTLLIRKLFQFLAKFPKKEIISYLRNFMDFGHNFPILEIISFSGYFLIY